MLVLRCTCDNKNKFSNSSNLLTQVQSVCLAAGKPFYEACMADGPCPSSAARTQPANKKVPDENVKPNENKTGSDVNVKQNVTVAKATSGNKQSYIKGKQVNETDNV